MNDILICKRPHGRALVLGETPQGKRWIQDNMITVDGIVWISNEVAEEVAAQMRIDDIHVEIL